MAQQGQYPVIFLDFKDIQASTSQALESSLKTLMSEVYKKFKTLLKPSLNSDEKPYFQGIIDREISDDRFSNSLLKLSEYLYQFYGKRVIILIDEYDSPLHKSYMNGFYEGASEAARNLFGPALKGSPYLQKAILTGILRIARESFFSGLNHLQIRSILSRPLSTHFGFTEFELERMLNAFGLSPRLDEVRKWYNGYRFDKATIYNPWSILCFLSDPAHKCKLHWVNTSDNALIQPLIVDLDIKNELEVLLRGETVRSTLNEHLSFRELGKGLDNLWSMLTFSGYLKIVKEHENKGGQSSYDLAIPNLELVDFYRETVTGWAEQNIGNTGNLLNALIQADFARFERELSQTIQRSASFFDVSQKPEVFYHAFMLGTLVQEESRYVVRSNRESGFGRYDLQLTPRDPKRPGFILEFKRVFKDAELERALDEACRQIGELHYETELKVQGVKEIYGVAIAFAGKNVRVRVASLGGDTPQFFAAKPTEVLVRKADVLVIAGTKLERDAVLNQKDLFESAAALKDRDGFLRHKLKFRGSGDGPSSVLLAYLAETEQAQVTHRVKQLVKEFEPTRLALVGAGIGNPSRAELGDVCLASTFMAKPSSSENRDGAFLLEPRSKALAEELEDTWVEPLRKIRPLSFRMQEDWLLLQLLGGESWPLTAPNRQQDCPDYNRVLRNLLKGGWIEKGALTQRGLERVQPDPLMLPELSPDPVKPSLVIGPMLLEGAQAVEEGFIAKLNPVAGTALMTANLPILVVQGIAALENQDENPAFVDYAAQTAARFLLCLVREIGPL